MLYIHPSIIPPFILSPSLNRHGYSFTKVQLSLYFMFNFTLFYLPLSLSSAKCSG